VNVVGQLDLGDFEATSSKGLTAQGS
jgi:hypothetical protein